ncbi:IS630 family transposase [Vibrio rarus]|uniref:IS630 family transposase n=1 Tax=Vibrio rarus TaxID=413403 RepID=UPI0021C341CA|nr:IS630 family transposase [Vibrio rarus]
MNDLRNTDFKSLARKQKSNQMKMRLLALSHIQDGHSRTQTAKFLKVSRTSVNKWVATFLEQGFEGLKDKPRTGRRSYLSSAQKQQLSIFINENSVKPSGGRLTGMDVRSYIEDHFGKTYHLDSVYVLLKKLGFSWITSRSKHPKQSKQTQEDFKKFQIETIFKIPGHVALNTVDVWFQDEARFGQQNTTTKLWATKGTRPEAIQQKQFEYSYLFGSVCPSRGIGEALVVPCANKEVMQLHLEQVSKATLSGRHALVVMDGAGWHTEELADNLENVSILKIPPYAPELNPIEQVWSWMRQHHLANKTFTGFNDIVDCVSKAWNDFLALPERVTNMCTRQWINLTN